MKSDDINLDKERGLYEADMRAHGYSSNDLACDSSGNYRHERAAGGWIGWQAKARISRQAAPEARTRESELLHIEFLLGQFQQEVWDVAQSDNPDFDYAGRETAKQLVAAIRAVAAAPEASATQQAGAALTWTQADNLRRTLGNIKDATRLADVRSLANLGIGFLDASHAATTASASTESDLAKWPDAVERDKRVRAEQMGRAPAPSQEAALVDKWALLRAARKHAVVGGENLGLPDSFTFGADSLVRCVEQYLAHQGAAQAAHAGAVSEQQLNVLPARRFINVTGFWDADYVEFEAGCVLGGGVLDGVPHASKHYTLLQAERYVKEGAWREVAVPDQSEASRCRAQGGETKDNSSAIASNAADQGEKK